RQLSLLAQTGRNGGRTRSPSVPRGHTPNAVVAAVAGCRVPEGAALGTRRGRVCLGPAPGRIGGKDHRPALPESGPVRDDRSVTIRIQCFNVDTTDPAT